MSTQCPVPLIAILFPFTMMTWELLMGTNFSLNPYSAITCSTASLKGKFVWWGSG